MLWRSRCEHTIADEIKRDARSTRPSVRSSREKSERAWCNGTTKRRTKHSFEHLKNC